MPHPTAPPRGARKPVKILTAQFRRRFAAVPELDPQSSTAEIKDAFSTARPSRTVPLRTGDRWCALKASARAVSSPAALAELYVRQLMTAPAPHSCRLVNAEPFNQRRRLCFSRTAAAAAFVLVPDVVPSPRPAAGAEGSASR